MVSGTRVGDRLEAMGFSRTPGEGGSRFMRLLGIGAGIIVLLFLIPNMVTYVNPGYVGIVIHRAGGGVDGVPFCAPAVAVGCVTWGVGAALADDGLS